MCVCMHLLIILWLHVPVYIYICPHLIALVRYSASTTHPCELPVLVRYYLTSTWLHLRNSVCLLVPINFCLYACAVWIPVCMHVPEGLPIKACNYWILKVLMNETVGLCMFAWTYVSLYVWMHQRISLFIDAPVCHCMCTCTCWYLYVCMYLLVSICMFVHVDLY